MPFSLLMSMDQAFKNFHAVQEVVYCRDCENVECEKRKVIDITKLNVLCFTLKGGNQMQAYCVKCRAKKEMKDAKSITMKNGKPATQGTCPTCGTKMFRIGKA